MKKTTLSVLLALVLVLSISASSVFAQDTWDEETVLTVFSDMQTAFPELFTDEESGDLLVDETLSFSDEGLSFGESGVQKSVGSDYDSKALIADPTGALSINSIEGKYSPCGDGRIELDIVLHKEDPIDTTNAVYGDTYRGNPYATYLRSIKVDVTANGTLYPNLSISDCRSTGGDSCRAVYFDSKGEARIKGYVTVPAVLTATSAPTLTLKIQDSSYMTIFWDVPDFPVTVSGTTTARTNRQDYCTSGSDLTPIAMGAIPAQRARYDENTGEARIQITLANQNAKKYRTYIIPAEIMVTPSGTGATAKSYDDYTCKYTMYNTMNGAPQTNYCTPGERMVLEPNAVVRFDMTIDALKGEHDGSPLAYSWRVGGMTSLITGTLDPVSNPGKAVKKMVAMDPLKPFMTFYEDQADDPIEASGPYSVYEGGVWGVYQKCGKYATIMARIQNNGGEDEPVNLDNVAVAINGGTPMKFRWVMSSQPAGKNKTIWLAPGDDLILIGKAKVTDIPSQMNSDTEITGAVNFIDYGLYLTGKVFSDRNNTACYVPEAK